MSSTTLTDLLVPTYKQNLKNVSAWLDKASMMSARSGTACGSHSGDDNKKQFENELLMKRLAPDMFPLATQVRFVCYQAVEAVYRLQGVTEIPQQVLDVAQEGRQLGRAGAPAKSPSIDNDEEATMIMDTIQAAKARIEEAFSFLEALEVDALDKDGAAERMIVLELQPPDGGNTITFDLTGEQYARDWALPQFYFHTVTAYSILRHAGVDLGKADYVPHMFAYLRPPATTSPSS